jgi:hypothetical protein
MLNIIHTLLYLPPTADHHQTFRHNATQLQYNPYTVKLQQSSPSRHHVNPLTHHRTASPSTPMTPSKTFPNLTL